MKLKPKHKDNNGNGNGGNNNNKKGSIVKSKFFHLRLTSLALPFAKCFGMFYAVSFRVSVEQ